jgi:hypothetical protein
MWSYYGSKNRISHVYPTPTYPRIRETCAGAGNFSLRHFEKECILYDKSPMVITIWKHLQACSFQDIMKLPNLPKGTVIDRSMFDCDGEYFLMKFMIVQAAYGGNNVVSKWGAMRFESNRRRVANNLFKIKHWQFYCDSYENIPNDECTWFIDPPYQFGGHKYPFSNRAIDFKHLGDWCKERMGQVIVCENTKADWLPFVPVCEMNGVQHKTTEAIWTNYHTHYNNIQQTLLL